MEQDQIFEYVERAKHGDSEAFTELYNAAYGMVYHTCIGHMRNVESAEDATQDTFVTVYNHLASLADNNTFFGWVKTIAVRVCLHKLRSTHDDLSYDDAIESNVNLEGDANLEDLPDSMIMEEEKRKIFLSIIKSELSEVQYQTVFMFYYDNMPVEQIAEIMQCPVGTVKTRLKASRVKLRSGIEDYEKRTGDKLCAAGAIPALGVLFASNLNSVPYVVPAFKIGLAYAAGASAATPSAEAGISLFENTAKSTKAGSKASKAAAAAKNGTAGKAATATAAKTGIATKIVAGVAATAVLAGGTIGIMKLMEDNPLENLHVGDVFEYGTFGGEDLKWRVIGEDDGKYFVTTEYCVGSSIFGYTFNGTTWEQSEIRTWLNDSFYNNVFTEQEQRIILTTNVSMDIYSGNDTQDKLFLLSVDEVNEYLVDTEYLSCDVNSEHAVPATYWLRSTGHSDTEVYPEQVAVVEDDVINEEGLDIVMSADVRPAMWIDPSIIYDRDKYVRDNNTVVPPPVEEMPEESVFAYATLEEYFAVPEHQAALDEEMQTALEMGGGIYIDADAYAVENTMYYEYWFSVNSDDSSVTAYVNEDMLNSMAPMIIDSIRQETGVTGEITLKYIYYYADGELLRELTYTSAVVEPSTTTTSPVDVPDSFNPIIVDPGNDNLPPPTEPVPGNTDSILEGDTYLPDYEPDYGDVDVSDYITPVPEYTGPYDFAEVDPCPVCHGYGWTTDDQVPCSNCGGDGYVS